MYETTNNDILAELESPLNQENSFDLSSLISSLDEKLEAENTEAIVENVETPVTDGTELISQDIREILSEVIIPAETATENEYIVINDTKETPKDLDMAQIINTVSSVSILNIDEIDVSTERIAKLEHEIKIINKQRRHKKLGEFIIDKTKFLANYVLVSSLVFVILLGGANYSAYSKIAYNFVNPDGLKNSSKEILSAIDNSKIKVYADEESANLGKDQQRQLQENLSKDNVQLRDTYFSPKKLVPLKSNVNLNVDIVPFENRIMIPKLGKNIPLVDVDSRRGNLDFQNLENVFMSELEKGVLRYPGTAKPGENGVSFIFGHSSNYPWMKGDYNDVFALLDNLIEGDEIIIYYNQKKYTYVIKEKKVIKPGNVKILERDPNKKELSLMTCWPIGTSINRLITFAELKEEK